MKEFLKEIESDVRDIKNKKFEYISTKLVPSRNDTSFTFERGKDKIGKTIVTCVLFVDIRNSIELNRTHHSQTMGRIYSVFSKSMLKVAKYHNGSVRNIIGDRVMIVFPVENCFSNAINCAITINHIAQEIISKVFPDVEFKCGIGVDYGELKVVKVGIVRKGTENVENKNLVWVGYPSNIASRLTDFANKTKDNTTVKVTYNPYDWSNIPGLGYTGDVGYTWWHSRRNQGGLYLKSESFKYCTLEEFANSLSFSEDLSISYSGGKLLKVEKQTNKIEFPSILITDNVYIGLKKSVSTEPSIVDNWIKFENHNIKDVKNVIYGKNLIYKI